MKGLGLLLKSVGGGVLARHRQGLVGGAAGRRVVAAVVVVVVVVEVTEKEVVKVEKAVHGGVGDVEQSSHLGVERRVLEICELADDELILIYLGDDG